MEMQTEVESNSVPMTFFFLILLWFSPWRERTKTYGQATLQTQHLEERNFMFQLNPSRQSWH